MRATLPLLRHTDFPPLRRARLSTLQVNLGYRCNQTCLHCHVNAGPTRSEMMDADNVDRVSAVLEKRGIGILDITGGAPELHPHFRTLVDAAHAMGVSVIDRCNLTVLLEPGQEGLADFLAVRQVRLVASLPCYSEANVDGQRGKGVFGKSITALRRLNALGYGRVPELVLDLVYNPAGPALPPEQTRLEADYKRELAAHHGIVFNRLLTLANMPIQRFGSTLISRGQFEPYMRLLKDSYRADNLDRVMCRNLVSVDWQGYLYDCDFNQMLGLPARLDGRPRPHLRDLLTRNPEGETIRVADHCYGCTAGQGSSCGGALN
jgi:radical SAM/Cys-rich protein